MTYINDWCVVIFTCACYYDENILWINLNSDKIIHKKEMESRFKNVSEIYYFLKAYHETLRERSINDSLIQRFRVFYHFFQDCFIFLCDATAKQIGCSDCDGDVDPKPSGICFSCLFFFFFNFRGSINKEELCTPYRLKIHCNMKFALTSFCVCFF